MIGFVLRRVVGLLPTLLVIVVVSFLVIRLAPGSPFSSERNIPPEVVHDLMARYGFDRPMPEQLVRYVGNLLRGDLGLSTKYPQRTVNEIIADGLPSTLSLAAVALAWSLLLGLGAGILGAIRQNTRWDYAAMAAAMVGISVPTFVLGPLLVLVFALTLYWFPPAGWGGLRHVSARAHARHGVRRVHRAAHARRHARGGARRLRAHRARQGAARARDRQLRHMLRGGLAPVVTFLGPALADCWSAAGRREDLRHARHRPVLRRCRVQPRLHPGDGHRGLVRGLPAGDEPLVDVVYGLLDPRVRYD